MDFMITMIELESLMGLPHLQQLTYIRGIRPYMDLKTNIVGIKRKISYQSIAEALYIEPHPGIKSGSPSRDQLRRAIKSLERAELIKVQSDDKHLILKCLLANADYSGQNKAATNPPSQTTTFKNATTIENTNVLEGSLKKADIAQNEKAAIPLKDNNYLYILLSHFEKFWSLYPEKKSKQAALEVFKSLNPDNTLFQNIMRALEAQINHRNQQEALGHWVPPWKYPANWLSKRAFEDELTQENLKENKNATNWNSSKPKREKDIFWCEDDSSITTATIIPFKHKS